MLKLEINEKKYDIPTSYNELTLKQYCKAFYKLPTSTSDDEAERLETMKKNEATILSRIMGEKDDFCLDLPWGVYQKLADAISFIYDDSLLKNTSSHIIINGERYSIPPMNEMSLRQFIDADVVMKEENDDSYIELLSVLLLKRKDGKYVPYDGDYKERMKLIGNAPCSVTLPLVFHFFLKGNTFKKLSEASMKVDKMKLLPQVTQNS